MFYFGYIPEFVFLFAQIILLTKDILNCLLFIHLMSRGDLLQKHNIVIWYFMTKTQRKEEDGKNVE